MANEHRFTIRRRNRVTDRFFLALACGSVLSLGRRLPPWLEQLSLGKSVEAAFRGVELAAPGHFSVVGEVGVLSALFFLGWQSLSRWRQGGAQSLGLTRTLVGLGGVVTGLALLFHGAFEAGLPLLSYPWGLIGLGVSASFGRGPGLCVGLLLGALGCLSGLGEGQELLVLAQSSLPVLLFHEMKRPVSALRASFGAALMLSAVLLGLSLESTRPVARAELGWLLLGGGLGGGFFLFLRGHLERAFGFVSRERLYRLLDLEQPLLKRMMERAPGSFEHSRAMANLAEQAASAIGADALLTRVGAYYHDLGKSFEPTFFVENLTRGQVSPHQELTPVESARIIVEHVSRGVRLLREHGIPEPVVEFAYTHHGTQLVEYFLNKARKQANSEEIDESLFRYPGMKPITRETAILMLVDSIEAASRTVDPSNRDGFLEMVRRVVFSKLESGQLDDADLSLEQLKIICARTVEALIHMNHNRIKYPWQEEQERVADRASVVQFTSPQDASPGARVADEGTHGASRLGLRLGSHA